MVTVSVIIPFRTAAACLGEAIAWDLDRWAVTDPSR